MTVHSPLQVDVVGWVIDRLAAAGIARIGAETPADLAAQMPFVRVERVGGPNDGFILDAARLSVDCFGGSRIAANALGYTVGATLRALLGTVADGAVMTRLRVDSGPSKAPWVNTDVKRAVVLLQIYLMATA